MKSYLQHGKVLVEGTIDELQSLRDKGYFGVIKSKVLELSLYEGLYLLEKGKITVYDKINKPLTIAGYSRKARLMEERFWVRYKVYSDIRKKGYITKAALKYGADFTVYDRGTVPGRNHSKWLLFAVNAGDSFDWRRFTAMTRVAHGVRKDLMIGVLDSQGDVTYYTINWVKP